MKKERACRKTRVTAHSLSAKQMVIPACLRMELISVGKNLETGVSCRESKSAFVPVSSRVGKLARSRKGAQHSGNTQVRKRRLERRACGRLKEWSFFETIRNPASPPLPRAAGPTILACWRRKRTGKNYPRLYNPGRVPAHAWLLIGKRV